MRESFDLRELVEEALIQKMRQAAKRAGPTRVEWLVGAITLAAHFAGEDRSEPERHLVFPMQCCALGLDPETGEELANNPWNLLLCGVHPIGRRGLR